MSSFQIKQAVQWEGRPGSFFATKEEAADDIFRMRLLRLLFNVNASCTGGGGDVSLYRLSDALLNGALLPAIEGLCAEHSAALEDKPDE